MAGRVAPTGVFKGRLWDTDHRYESAPTGCALSALTGCSATCPACVQG
jgi:hypothetical protein